ASGDRLPASAALTEAMRRRRAAGGPAERTFAALVGMELRPRALREAHTVFAAIRSQRGAEARDALWAHPDLLPTPDDLDDPLGFAQGSGAVPDTIEGLEAPGGESGNESGNESGDGSTQ
ncbi:MAG TPA: hydrolase, partial [Actinobacteria bacterium]|nr:hydrolase [Actinomycetota bacterium]